MITKLSEIDIDKLTPEQRKQLVFNGISTKVEGKPKDPEHTAIIVLGATVNPSAKRVMRGVDLYLKGYGKYIVMTGGNKLSKFTDEKVRARYLAIARQYFDALGIEATDDEILNMTETDIMREISDCIAIPDEDIIMERESKTTPDNMKNVSSILFDPPSVGEGKEFLDIKNMIIVTNANHGLRALCTAKKYLPNINFTVSTIDEMPATAIDETNGEAKKLHDYALKGDIYDAEVEIDSRGNVKALMNFNKEEKEI